MKTQRMTEFGRVQHSKGRRIPSALQRFNWEFRVIRDASAGVVGREIPLDWDARTPRARQCGETSGFLYAHDGRNRATRRALSRDYGMTGIIEGSNRPLVLTNLSAEDLASYKAGSEVRG